MAQVFMSVYEFADTIHKAVNDDRDALVACGGFTGVGKSTFTTQLLWNYGKVSGQHWGFEHMTYSRPELMTWINGEKDSEPDSNNLRKGQLPEKSGILVDELFSMFYKRNWHDNEQIDAIATFNMCRDRHLFLAGNIPSWDDLDSAFKKRVRWYAYIPKRGVAWVFEQENNPFTRDPWMADENYKRLSYGKSADPSKCRNYVCTIHFGDWQGDLKDEYYKIRNAKRLKALSDDQKAKSDKKDKYKVKYNNLRLYLGKVVNMLREHNKWDDIRVDAFCNCFTHEQLVRLNKHYEQNKKLVGDKFEF